MANNPQPNQPEQSFAGTERLFRRVRGNNIGRDGKATLFAFELPDMSVNRELHGSAEDARKGFDRSEWSVVAFLVADIPPRADWHHLAQLYRLLPRHVIAPGNFAHSEVRAWRKIDEDFVFITNRGPSEFTEDDPDRECARGLPEALLDPDFHLRWRKHIALASKMALPCEARPGG
jgi:hypothetical protein